MGDETVYVGGLEERVADCNGARSRSTDSRSAWPNRLTVHDQALPSNIKQRREERGEKRGTRNKERT